MINKLIKELKGLANQKKAKVYQRFFKSGKGEYGEGDVFLGLTVPQSRKIAIKYKDLSFDDIRKLLQSKIHEERLIALLILVQRFNQKENPPSSKDYGEARKEVFDFYLANTKYINNWDLVDLSVDKIVGRYLLEIESRHSGNQAKPEHPESLIRLWTSQNDVLIKLAHSRNLWERRIAIIATYQFIKEKKEYGWTFRIAEILLNDPHDLIHKAVGWMLREVGKQCSQEILEEFLRKHYKQMPRTMLRYTIEKFPKERRKHYLLGTI